MNRFKFWDSKKGKYVCRICGKESDDQDVIVHCRHGKK